MAETKSALQFSATTKSSDLWKSVSLVIMTIVDEAIFEATPEGLKFRSMDPSHVALIDIDCPKSAFEKFDCASAIKFGIRIGEFAKVVKRAAAKDSVEISVQNSLINIKTSGSYLRNYRLNMIESNAASSPLPKLSFDSRLVISPAVIDRVLSDIEVVSEKIAIETTKDRSAIFSGESDNGSVTITLDEKSGIEMLQELSVTEPCKASFAIEFISRIVRAVGASSELAKIELASNKPIKISFALSNDVKIEFYMAPRVEE